MPTAGFLWHQKGNNGFKLVHEQIDGKAYIIPGKIATGDQLPPCQ